MNEMLSPHFSRSEFEHSDTARRLGLANVMGAVELAAARALCFQILEPLRAHFGGRAITLNSGYRAPAVNRAVGSKPGSQHERGEASDIEIAGVSNADLAQYIKGSTLDFDQLILEAYNPGVAGSGWVHVSRSNRGRQRRACLTMTMGSHGAVYSQGINP
jgi:D-alanyl-D-alanine dipeptidase